MDLRRLNTGKTIRTAQYNPSHSLHGFILLVGVTVGAEHKNRREGLVSLNAVVLNLSTEVLRNRSCFGNFSYIKKLSKITSQQALVHAR